LLGRDDHERCGHDCVVAAVPSVQRHDSLDDAAARRAGSFTLGSSSSLTN